MKLFSYRKGLKAVRQTLQLDDVDTVLRNGIWNALLDSCWQHISTSASEYTGLVSDNHYFFLRGIWADYFKLPADKMPNKWPTIFETLRKYYFESKWNEVYDFIEFVASTFPYSYVTNEFVNRCNITLERELSAYRFVGRTVVQLTSEQEISEIERALDIPDSMDWKFLRREVAKRRTSKG